MNGKCQAMTASIVAPVSLAYRSAQRSACSDDAEPSTPTTMRGLLPPLGCSVMTASMRVRVGPGRPDGAARVRGPGERGGR